MSELRSHKVTEKSDTNLRLVPLHRYLDPLVTDWKYATPHNFTGQVLYKNPEAYLRLPVARALAAAQNELKTRGLCFKIFDAYRPYSVTKKMWAIVPDERYAANPAKGSGHNRGAAVDLTLIDLRTRRELALPTAFDDFSEKAHHNYRQLPPEVIANRSLLRQVMEKHGFIALETEWWHYSWPQASRLFPLLDLSFEELRRRQK